ncbi:MAG: hypothetical protein ACJ748_06770 [Flavisolibacter sp.]
MNRSLIFFLCSLSFLKVLSQDSSRLNKIISLPDKLFASLDKKTHSIETSLDKQTTKYLARLQKQENKLRSKLFEKDSSLAKQLFNNVNHDYEALRSQKGKLNALENAYSGHLDSLSTSLKFLNESNLQGLTGNSSLQKTLSEYAALQNKLNATNEIQKYISRRQQLLKEQFEKLGIVSELKKFRKQVYYYQQQVREYKQLFEDPNKLEEKLLSLAQSLPQFKDFFARNSILGSLFALPGRNGSSPMASIQGLQTRAMINQSLADRFGSGPDISQMLQQNMQGAQGQLSELKNKVSSLSTGSYGNGADKDMQDFKPNNQKTKSFLQRLEVGTNVQSQKAQNFFPVTSDLGLSIGYKLNDKSIMGVGASYKLGLGRGWNNIRLSHQGVGLRSFVDYKIKGSFYLSGGYEQNYRSLITSIDQLRNYSAWQSSGLLGLSKRYQVSKKLKGEMKLLWDFFSYRQLPRTQAVLFRIGYSFK